MLLWNDSSLLCAQEEKRALHVKLRRALLGEHLREEQGNKEASTQTDQLPDQAGSPPPLRTQASAQTPRQRAHSVLQSQPRVCLHANTAPHKPGAASLVVMLECHLWRLEPLDVALPPRYSSQRAVLHYDSTLESRQCQVGRYGDE